MSKDWAEAERYIKQWERYTAWDKALYRLCSDFPNHENKPGVYAKVYLIGRSYQTGIERHATDKRGKRKPLDAVAELLYDKRKQVDRAIQDLMKLGNKPDAENVETICKAHSKLLRVVSSLTSRGSPRSFVSKYLHFHAPVLPIYDSIASTVISSRSWKNWTGKSAPKKFAQGTDDKYRTFCHKIVQMSENWRACNVGIEPTAKHMDIYLVSWDR